MTTGNGSPPLRKKLTFQLPKRTLLFCLLFGFWLILCGAIDTRQVITGLFASAFTLFLYEWLLKNAKVKPMPLMPKVHWLKLLKIGFISILKSAWHHVFRIISGNEEIVFVQILLDTNHPYVNTLIANMITLTPGAVSVELDKNILKILSYAPKNEKEHQALYTLVDDLQSAFGRSL